MTDNELPPLERKLSKNNESGFRTSLPKRLVKYLEAEEGDILHFKEETIDGKDGIFITPAK